MSGAIRRFPPICLCVSLARLLTGKLRRSKEFLGSSIAVGDGPVFTVFRQIVSTHRNHPDHPYVFVVTFKFARLSHDLNKIASIVPMLLIAGQPGFSAKAYAVNLESGYWRGMYEWDSKQHLDRYKDSLVFRVMNKRTVPGSLESLELRDTRLGDFLRESLSR